MSRSNGTPGAKGQSPEDAASQVQGGFDFGIEGAMEAGPGKGEDGFEELALDDPGIDEDLKPSFAILPASRGVLKKANEAIVMRPTRGDFVFLSRKISNVLLYHAQQQGLQTNDTFSIPRRLLCSDAGFDSRDIKMLRERFLSLMSTTVEWGWVGDAEQAPNGRIWEGTTLLASAGFYLQKGTNEIWIRWSYSNELKKQLLESTQYTKLSLAIIARLRSMPALSLYELASRYATSPSKISKKATWEAWVTILRGKPIKEYPTLDFRRFKKETLLPAKAQVNSEQDEFTVEFKEYKTGKKVTHLQMVVTLNATERPDMDLRHQMDINLFTRMLQVGINQYAADAIYGSCDENVLRAAIEQLELRIQNKKLPAINSTEAYLKQRIRALQDVIENKGSEGDESAQKKLIDTEQDRPKPESQRSQAEAEGSVEGQGPAKGAETAQDRPGGAGAAARWKEQISALQLEYERRKTARAREMYENALDGQKQEWQAQFGANFIPTAGKSVQSAFEKRGIQLPIVRVAFFKWLADTTWPGTLDEMELMQWAMSSGVITLGV